LRLPNWTRQKQHGTIFAMFGAAGFLLITIGLIAQASVVRWLWLGKAWWEPERLRSQRNWHPSFAPTRQGLPHVFWLAVIWRSIQGLAAIGVGVYFVSFKG